MELTLDGKLIKDKNTLYEEIRRQIPIPDYFGRNLDALHDILSEQADDIKIRILDEELLKEALGGSYYYQLIDMLDHCCYEIQIEESPREEI